MSEFSENHDKRHETVDHAHTQHCSHDSQHDHKNLYGDYGVDYGERARRILESSKRDSSAFDTVGHGHHVSQGGFHNTLKTDDIGIDVFQRRRHSMFADTTNVKHENTPIHHVNQMHLDDIVLAYKKKHPHHRAISPNPSKYSNECNVTEGHTKPISADRNKFAAHHEHTRTDERIHLTLENMHRSTASHFNERTRPCEIHKGGYSSGSHGSDRDHGEHGKRIGGHVTFVNSGLKDIGARSLPMSPTEDGSHHVIMSRANGYKNELSSPELERLSAYRDRERTKEFERHAIAHVITEACKKRHENEKEDGYQHTHRRHSGQTMYDDYAGRPIEGERRHTLASTTLKEMRHRCGKNQLRIEAIRKDVANEMHGIPLTHEERHHADSVSWYGNTNEDSLHVPDESGRRHSWATSVTRGHFKS